MMVRDDMQNRPVLQCVPPVSLAMRPGNLLSPATFFTLRLSAATEITPRAAADFG
jgi:hypothetical protein